MTRTHSRIPYAAVAAFFVTAISLWISGADRSDAEAADRGENTSPQSTAEIDFEKQIAPLLARRCLECHSGNDPQGKLNLATLNSAMKGGETGKALVPGDLKKSLLWERVDAGDMPPKGPLPEEEQQLLKRWIASGAKWPGGSIDMFRYTTDRRAGYDWWSLQPVKRPATPGVMNGSWSRNPIDRFVLAKLNSAKLAPSEPAKRRTLIRRLSFDLLGLPPTVEETAAFLADRSPDAYEKLVDRMLASPHYGERWARHWLDIVRFGESQGFERDKLRPNAWRYRDWVVEAFNTDMPYDRFVRSQLAGDAIAPGDPQSIIATGFLVAGAYDEVGQNQQSAAMRAVVRQDELEDIVSSVGQTFLGLTVNCARCHDHKFDPVRQREYYRLTAALAGVRHGERNVGNFRIRRQAQARVAGMRARVEFLGAKIARMEASIRRRVLNRRKSKPRVKVVPPRPIAAWDFRKSLRDHAGELGVKLHGKSERVQSGLRFDGKTGFAATVPLKSDLTAKTLEAWVRLDDLAQRGGGVMNVQSLDGRVFDAIVFGEREPKRWLAGSNHFARTRGFTGPPEAGANREFVHVAIAYHADGTIRGYRNGRPYGSAYKASRPIRFAAGKSQVVFGMRHAPAGGNRMLSGTVQRARLYDRALSPAEVAASAGVEGDYVSNEELLTNMSPDDRQLRSRLRFEADRLQEQIARAGNLKTYSVVPRRVGPAYLLLRGNPARRGPEVKPGGVAALKGVKAEFGLTTTSDDSDRRIELAEWITDRRNPLFARVMVNRLWHYHFGTGIVSTPSDFGFNGGRPSHPRLLDWLAAELVRSGWSLKHLQRLMVTSATYRQSSRLRPAAAKIDAGNRLLWRKSPQRLDAESVRDAILRITGELNPAMGGPGYTDFTTFVRNTQFYKMVDPIGRTFHRRSLYRTWVRSGRNRFLDVFDCPDPSTKTPKRAVTITPIQALALMNNSFVLRMSARFADRLRMECGDQPAGQIDAAWRLAYGRAPSAVETNAARAFLRQHGLAALCRVLLNSNEFLFVD